MIRMVDDTGRSIGTVTKSDIDRSMNSRPHSRRTSMFDLRKEDGGVSDIKSTCNKTSRMTLVLACLILSVLSLILLGIGIFAPAWWLLDVTEYGQEWQFGLWMYCRRGGNHNEVGAGGLDLRDWICDLRSTIPVANQGYNTQAAFVRADHNEIPVIICLSIAFIFMGISMFALCCAYCNKYIPYCLILTNFMAMLMTLIGVLMYIVSMQDVEARRFTSYNSVYILNFGYACFCTIAACVLLVINFVVSIPLVILTFAWNREDLGQDKSAFPLERRSTRQSLRKSDATLDVNEVRRLLAAQPVYPHYHQDARDMPFSQSIDDGNSVLVVERDPDTKSIVSVRRFDNIDDAATTIRRTPSNHNMSVSREAHRVVQQPYNYTPTPTTPAYTPVINQYTSEPKTPTSMAQYHAPGQYTAPVHNTYQTTSYQEKHTPGLDFSRSSKYQSMVTTTTIETKPVELSANNFDRNRPPSAGDMSRTESRV